MKPMSSRVRSAALAVAAAASALAAMPGAAQERAGPQERACTLVLEPATDSTRSTAIQVAEDQYVTHVGNGLRWTCGDSRMYADSAVKYDRERRLRAIGSIDYRDSTRTLTADTLTYHESEDRLVAEGNAVLRQRARGATLSGPRIEFLRAASAVDRRTVATGRPHLTVEPDSAAADTAAPTEMDGDRIVLVGQSEVRSWGDVRIERPDMTATADSAFFRLEEGESRLFGSPRVEGSSFTLTGRTIHTGSDEGELRNVEAHDSARAFGDDFDLYADTITARLSDREIERLWAHGEGRSVALAPPYRLEADSLAFRFREGRLDTLHALNGAEAVEVGDSLPGDPRRPIPLDVGERSWLAADTLVMAFASDSVASPSDTGTADGDDVQLRRVLAVGSARAYRVMSDEEDGADGPSLHYQRGSSIVIEFEEGRASRLEGERAIGVHLDPMPGTRPPSSPVPGGDEPGEGAPGDSAAPTDSIPPPTPDTAEAEQDTTEAEPPASDTAAADSTRAREPG